MKHPIKATFLRHAGTLLIIIACATTIGCRENHTTSAPANETRTFPVAELGRFYQANARIEMDQEKNAGEIIEALMASVGREPALVANLAIVRLAAAQNDAALALAAEASVAAPENADIALILAGAQRAGGKFADAHDCLKAAIEAHPNDERLRWAYVQAIEMGVGPSAASEALGQFEAILRVAPANLAALLSAARTAAAAENVPEANRLLRRALAQIPEPPESLAPYLDELDEAIAGKNIAKIQSIITRTRNLMLATDRYKADVIALGASADQTPAPVRHPIWPLSGNALDSIKAEIRFEKRSRNDLLALAEDAPAIQKIVVGCVAADRSPALCVIDAAAKGRLFVFDAGRYIDKSSDFGLAEMPPCRNVLFVDLNNDKRMDLLISSAAGDRYFRQDASGRFQDVSDAIGLSDGVASNGAKPYDYDNDGDLDLLRWDDARLYLHQNDGEGNLRAIDARPGLSMEIADVFDVRTLDLDDDGDVDLFITAGHGPYAIHVISNERLASFRDVTDALTQMRTSYIAPPEIADLDNDGWLEVIDVTFGSRTSIGPEFETKMLDGLGVANHPSSVAIADFDNNAALDTIFMNGGGRSDRDDVVATPGATLQAVDLDSDGRVDLLSDRGEAFMNRTQGAGNWLRVSLVGLNTGDSRFNALGLGSTIELRCGPLYQKRHVEAPTTHFGLGPFNQADVMRVVWPNGSYQSLEYRANSTTALAANRTVVEEQTLKGSCPYLYAWNGERFEFVTDVLWRSALGMSIMQGVYGHYGTADDYFKIDGDRLKPEGGEYRLSFTEELWETSYFDYCRLFVVDHPIGTDIYVDEKCLTPPYPPFEILKVAHIRHAVSAVDERDRDLLSVLGAKDGRYVGGFEKTRYQGLVEPHDLILDLGEFDRDEPIRLYLQGWLWPTDASTNVAVSQNPDVSPQMPKLEVIAADGAWVDTNIVVGFPSGKSKTIALDLSGAFPTDDHRVRLQTNFCIYWDHAFFTVGAQNVELRVSELKVNRAELRERGISYQVPRHPGGPRIPEYDALNLDAHWRDLIGGYSAIGDVTNALLAVDDDYVIVGAGDEVLMSFDAGQVPPLPDGWTRDFIVHTDGWLKDGDLNSATGKTVGPLPWHGMTAYPPLDDGGKNKAHLTDRQTRNRDQDEFRRRLRP
ncbi:MAG: CRTAC1 family protein [Phycisphaerales bacterium]|nr:CRTAC1 family protein [Phycisphaerales bacterium]MCB9855950.1 CRTAC1 family protein [Phycisphaerales bacterium]MCB9864069.1 CRTAC1 family protein [Phycisphaerales bacterium]